MKHFSNQILMRWKNFVHRYIIQFQNDLVFQAYKCKSYPQIQFLLISSIKELTIQLTFQMMTIVSFQEKCKIWAGWRFVIQLFHSFSCCYLLKVSWPNILCSVTVSTKSSISYASYLVLNPNNNSNRVVQVWLELFGSN